jgi:enediyne biosynthesis protein E4
MRIAGTLALVALVVACNGGTAPPVTQGADPASSTGAAPQTTTPATGGSPSSTAASAPTSEGEETTTCWSSAPSSGSEAISFSDQSAALGLVEPLTGMYGHAAAFGDTDGDGVSDLVVGTFANRPPDAYQVRGATGPSPDRLLRGGDEFVPEDGFPGGLGRTAAAVAADLDADGDHDVVLSRNSQDRPGSELGSQVMRNEGGSWTALDLPLEPWFKGRSIGVLDYDADGMLDLFIVEDRYFDGGSSVLLRNLGDLQFEDVTAAVGLPTGIEGLGVATADFDGNGFTDLFVSGSNRLFLAGDGGFTETPGAFAPWEAFGEEDDVAGSAAADVNRDGLTDLVVGQHYNSTVDRDTEVPVRLYVNRGADGGQVVFEDVTDQAGLIALPTKAPHVQLEDLDNDGWLDIITTASAGDGTLPAVFRGLGVDGEIPRFASPEGLGSDQYWVAGPTTDLDRDGRLDLFLVEWEPALPSITLHNETASGHWLQVSVSRPGGAVGSLVEVYEPGLLGDAGALLAHRQITIGEGYAAGREPFVHVGLGDLDRADVRVILPDGEIIEQREIAVDRRIALPEC